MLGDRVSERQAPHEFCSTIGNWLPKFRRKQSQADSRISPERVVFLGGESIDPAYDSRHILLQAGDIEQNPGPRPRPQTTVIERCSSCQSKFSSRSIKESCIHVVCTNKCHIFSCSHIFDSTGRVSVISRYKRGQLNWLCHEHGGPNPQPAKSSHPGKQMHVCPGKNHKLKEIKPQNVASAIKCDMCESLFHQCCTNLSKDAIKAIKAGTAAPWICHSCNNPVNPNFAETVDPTREISETQLGSTRDSLNIMQWNVDGLGTKTVELTDRLNSENIDICAIQETKLKDSDQSPTIKGYRPAGRSDRKGMKFGGVTFYVKDSLNFEQGQKSANAGTESSTIRVKLSRAKWIDITSVYTPPSHTTHRVSFAPQHIPATPNSIILGDMNGHDPIWDSLQPPDPRGEEISKWIFDNNLAVLNHPDKSTRINKRTGGLSSPDISVAGRNWSNKCSWSVGEQIDKSDHLPITLSISTNVAHQPIFGKQARWRRNGVNWKAFRDAVESAMSDLPHKPDITKRISRFNTILTDAASTHVGKSKPGPRTKVHMTPSVRAALKKRNRLRKNLHDNRKEWLEACKEAHEEIEKAKEESWRDLLADTATDADSHKLWGLIKSLNGTPDTNAPNQAMRHKGRIITSSQKKAETFSQHYASVSKLNFSSEERKVNRECKRTLASPSVDDESCKDFTMTELKRAISKMKRKGAEGPDNIPPAFLKELGNSALTELLSIFNISFRHADCPQIWRNAIILPLLKAGKLPSDLASYRPISLTSCIVKILERMINDRLYHLAESHGWFNTQQAGFRKGRGCDDQAARIIQAIEDGFQHKPMLRSILVLLDFSKAYDTVWQERLLLSMMDTGVPLTIIRWLRSFLLNRQAKVRFNGILGRSRKMKQGLPQGSVLSPILFLFYINNLAEILPTTNINSLFADDVSILAVRSSLVEAEAEAQKSVDVVVSWAKSWKLQLNATKSEVSFFTTSTAEARWSPTIMIEGTAIPFKETPRLLGVILDRQLTFGPHVKMLDEKLAGKYRMLAAVAHSTWGWKKQLLKRLYTSIFKSTINYAGFTWQSSLENTHVKAVERLINRALRICSGHIMKTPIEALYHEMREPRFETEIKRNATIAAEKCLRLQPDHPRRLAFDNAAPQRKSMKRSNWGIKAKQHVTSLNLHTQVRKPLTYFNHPPWLESSNVTTHPQLPGINNKDDPEDKIIHAAMDQIKSFNPTITIYTDGSASAGTTDGGAGIVCTTGDPSAPVITSTITVKGAKFTSSFGEEVTAMEHATLYILKHCTKHDIVVIATDSQSLCSSLANCSPESDNIRANLAKSDATIHIQWLPGHSNIPGNESADSAAKAAAKLEEPHQPTTFRSARSLVKASFRNGPGRYPLIDEAYGQLSASRDKEIVYRKHQVELARLRSGYSLFLRFGQNALDDSISPECPRCGAPTEDVEHWIKFCPGTVAARQDIFGPDTGLGLPLLTLFPRKSVILAQRTLEGFSSAGR